MEYEFRGTGLRMTYVTGERLLVRTKESFGAESEQLIRFDDLHSEPTLVRARDKKLIDRVIGVVVAFLLIPVAILLAYTRFGLWPYATPFMIAWFVVGIAACIGVALFGPRVEWVIFRYRSGEPAVAIGCGRGRRGQFDEFVQEIRDRIPAV